MTNKSSETFCVLPWIHLATHPNGNVSLCCQADFTNGAGMAQTDSKFHNLNDETIESHVNSDLFKRTRLAMLNNIQPPECSKCYKSEKLTGSSKRTIENRNFDQYTIKDATTDTSTDGTITPSFKFIELRLGNVCNAKCVTCNPASSTKWRKDYNIIQTDLPYVTQYTESINTGWAEDQRFWTELHEHVDANTVFYINGGEPTLVEAHWEFIRDLKTRGLTSVTLHYNINMRQIPDFAFELWNNFTNVYISCSIDDLEDRNEYIRYPTAWDAVISNLEKLLEYDFNVSITQTVSLLNYWYLPEFYQVFAVGYNIPIHHNIVTDPPFLNPTVLSTAFKIKCRTKLLNSDMPIDITQPLISKVESIDDSHLIPQAKQYLGKLDEIRGTAFNSIFTGIIL